MYLGAVQAPGLGKFCGQSYVVSKVFEKVQFKVKKKTKNSRKIMYSAQKQAFRLSEMFALVEHVLKGI